MRTLIIEMAPEEDLEGGGLPCSAPLIPNLAFVPARTQSVMVLGLKCQVAATLLGRSVSKHYHSCAGDHISMLFHFMVNALERQCRVVGGSLAKVLFLRQSSSPGRTV